MRIEVPDSDGRTDLDVRRIANTLIERHGPDAQLVALRWSDCAACAGDPARAAAWQRIVDTVSRIDARRANPKSIDAKCFVGARAA